MPKPVRSPLSVSRVPKYRRHKPTGQAVVTLNGRDIYLGKWNTRQSWAEYDRLTGEWLAAGRVLRQHESGRVRRQQKPRAKPRLTGASSKRKARYFRLVACLKSR